MSERLYEFRIRFVRSPRDAIESEKSELSLPAFSENHEVSLVAIHSPNTLKESSSIVLKGRGWVSEDEANEVGRRYFDALLKTFARLRLGADFGARAAKGFFTLEGLAQLEEKTGQRALNDVHGLMTFDRQENEKIGFYSSSADLLRGVQLDEFLRVYTAALENEHEITDRERVSLELFNASFFQDSVDGRFLLLVASIEGLISQNRKSDRVIEHVRSLAEKVREVEGLEHEEIEMLRQSLYQLQTESIAQAGLRLVSNLPEGTTYGERTPAELFRSAYSMRSRLIHGSVPFPSREDISQVAAQLEVMVSDLLSINISRSP